MKKLEVTKANPYLASLAKGVAGEPLVLTVDGKPVAALLDISNVDWDVADLTTLPIFVTMLEQIQAKMAAKEGIPDDKARWLLAVPPAG